MSNDNSFQNAVRILRTKLAEELVELGDALDSGQSALILDELVDAQYYVRRLAACRGISDDCLSRYAAVKTALRESGVRCKTLELRIASKLVLD